MKKQLLKEGIVILKIFILSTLLILTSCKSKFKIFNYETEELKISNLIDKVESNYVDVNTISIKFQIKYSSEDKKQVIQGMYRIKKDSIIWITLGPSLGMEAFRCILQKDTVKFINRLDKSYYEGSYQYINKLLNIDLNYETVENILLNKLVFTTDQNADWKDYMMKNYAYKIEANRYYLTANRASNITEDNRNGTNIIDRVIILPDIYKIEEMVWRQGKKKLTIKFDNFKKEKDIWFPQNYQIFFSKEEKVQNFDLKVKQITYEKKLKYPFKISEKRFTKIEE